MTYPIFSLQRTKENVTCGITNIPLTYPAKIFFNCDNEDYYYSCLFLMHQYSLPVYTYYIKTTNHWFISTFNEVDSKTIKQIWRNWKSLLPKFCSEYRYVMWELDSHSTIDLDMVLDVYRILKLPVYVHKTLRGYHFISVKPVNKSIFNWAIDKLRITNEDYPPITLRLKPNKYIGESEIWNDGFIISEKTHSDTTKLRQLIIDQNWTDIAMNYQLVWYLFDKKVNKE